MAECDSQYRASIDKTAVIYEHARIDNSKVGYKSIVYNYAWLRNSVLADHCFASDNSKVDVSNLDGYARCGKSCHLYHTSFGRHTYAGQNTVIMYCKIGNFSSISWNVTIGAGEHDYRCLSTHTFLYNPYDELLSGAAAYDRFSEKCLVGNDVWIGAGASILRGVEIGDGAVIGANSVVTHDVPPYAVVVGNPGKIIKYRFDEEIIHQLLGLRWWEADDETIKHNSSLFQEQPTKRNIKNIIKVFGRG